MLRRRKFLLGTVSLIGAAAAFSLAPLRVLAQTETANSIRETFTLLHKKWVALYDSDGHYITDIKLVRSDDDGSNTSLEQFSFRWKIRGNTPLEAGMYVLDDFSTEPRSIFLQPSYSKRRNGKFYRSSFSMLRQ